MHKRYRQTLTEKQEIRYIISGGTSAISNLLILYLLTDVFGLWYLFSSVASYICGFFVSFTLHKFWTFQSKELHKVPRQLSLHILLAGINLWLNTLLLYFFVEYCGLWYMFAQALTIVLIALEGYFFSKRIFR
jgi:putative flippase GtrA